MSSKHTPRTWPAWAAVGDGRQAIAPAKPKISWRRGGRGTGPELCGAAHPEVDHLTCTAHVRYEHDKKGRRKKVQHHGKHRNRTLVGITLRWSA